MTTQADAELTVGDDGSYIAKIRDTAGIVYSYDLSEFFTGGTARYRARCWSGDFTGRPLLAAQLRQVLERQTLSDVTLKKRIGSCRHMFRFLDDSCDLPAVREVADFTEMHGIRLKRWLSDRGIKSPDIYMNIKMLVFEGRASEGSPRLIWPARDPDPPSEVSEPDYIGIQRLSMALRKEAREVGAMWREGASLARPGCDPRVGDGRAAAWSEPANHAWLVRELTADKVPLKRKLIGHHASGLISTSSGIVMGPAYLPPTMSSRGRTGYVGKLRWFFPGLYDTAIYYWLVALHTGWNMATQVGIDITHKERWQEPHPHAVDRVLVHAWKERAERHQQAICNPKAEFHPPAIIKMLVERTAPLRRTLVAQLEDARRRYALKPSPSLARYIKKLEAGTKSPWLYVSLRKGGEIGWLTSETSNTVLNRFVRAVAKKHGLLTDHPSLAYLSTSDVRDAWINYAYITTGEALIAQYAANHKNMRSLRYYLARHRYRRSSEGQVRELQTHAFSEIREGRLDPTRLRVLVQTGRFTQEQASHLTEVRNRTRLNMGCLAPDEPPKSIDPDHQKGELCRVQRCTGCPNGIVFEDSMKSLATALADLHFERSQRPLAAWRGTSLEDEERSLSATLREFDPERVRQVYSNRKEALRTGAVTAFDAYPLY